jgi:hypothetical protein
MKTTVVNIYAPNIDTPNFIKQIVVDLQAQKKKSTKKLEN